MTAADEMLDAWRKPQPVVEPGAFKFAVAGMEHGHIVGQAEGLIQAGGALKWVFDERDPGRAAAMAAKHGAKHARELQEVLDDPKVLLVASADIPDQRAA